MARPKKISDSDVLLAAFEVISREGFESFTFEQVSKATRLSPAALVKRFKSKQRLALLARNQKWDDNLMKMGSFSIEQLHGLKGLFEFLRLIAKSVDSKRLGEHLRWLGTEAEDIKARKKVGAYFAETRSILHRLLQEAITNKELKKIENIPDFAMTLEALVQGSIFQFAYFQGGTIDRHLEERITSALQCYLIK
ncbi:TetR/AcrR family transcriptional regulator [Bdellovibrio bacteriovorus]|uniref:TetR/AcrR family transcriptional regulator n=1 Tax=Bdellovibrio bacteriovorus TaxID=959 RepID=UPI0021CE2340|nr:TetR/AcrR family transcriptional regulator [Bdellovibrio bacteriovorus]UXR63506.1 TetR/AcrR family transcriptional regulator [Bdellovibrio bacteriovorus]